MNPWIKYLITAAVIVIVSEVAKRSDKLGALLVSLPMVTILAMIWIFLDAKPDEHVKKLSDHAAYTFWYVIPTLPMFLVMPVLFKRGIHFGLVMLIYCLGTIALFYIWAKILEKFNIHLM
ncbi:DUF3147 family protein [Akkermansiaceae bacterium]|nr:DUF3147 family protein [Akkermansiaceae bacterium]